MSRDSIIKLTDDHNRTWTRGRAFELIDELFIQKWMNFNSHIDQEYKYFVDKKDTTI